MRKLEVYEKMEEALVRFEGVLDEYLEAEGDCSSSFLDSLAEFRHNVKAERTAEAERTER